MNKEIDKFVDLLFNFDMQELENETKFLENYKKLQNNWNELKKWLEDYIKTTENDYKQTLTEGCKKTQEIMIKVFKRVLEEMQELEGNNE